VIRLHSPAGSKLMVRAVFLIRLILSAATSRRLTHFEVSPQITPSRGDEYRELRPSPWSVKAGTTEDMIKNSETQMKHKQKAVLGASGGAIAAPGSANFT
jgi:hypothetical protein